MNFKKTLISLGMGGAIAGGIIFYLNNQKNYLTWEEYESLIRGYNTKIEEIKSICDSDIRCVNENGKKRIIFVVKNKEEIINKLNLWIKEENNKYKK